MLLDEDYLKLFKQVQESSNQTVTVKNYDFEQLRSNDTQSISKNEMLKETPDYGNFTNFNKPNLNQNLNEVNRSRYVPQNDNLNEFIIEKRFNDEPFENMNEVRRIEKEKKLNEILQHRQQEKINEVIKEREKEKENDTLNEKIDFENVDVVTVAMFERARFNSMMVIANRVIPK